MNVCVSVFCYPLVVFVFVVVFGVQIMYGQIETFLQVCNAYLSITFAEWCWVFMDGVWLVSFAFSLPLMDVAARLAESRPTSSLLGLANDNDAFCSFLPIIIFFSVYPIFF